MPDANIIEARGLTKRYGDFTAVDGIDFSVKRGEIFAFLGPNGAGKTTTIKMLTTLLHPDSGTLTIDGHDPAEEQDAVRRSFGIVFQDPSLDDELTAYENMEYHGILYGIPKAMRERRIEEMLSLVELADRRKDLVKTFSGGMKRRLEIARGLMHHPKIIFLDEPTLGLDPQTRNRIWEHVKELNAKEGVTVFLTTHYMEEAARIAGNIAVIDHGKIVALGTPAELEARTGATNLEDAFISLTGRDIRDEQATPADRMREHRRTWRH